MSARGKQMELAALTEAASYAKEAELPEGIAALNVREIRFVTQLLQHGNQGKAYQEAGFSATGPSAYAEASKLIRKPKVFRFYTRCLRNVSKDAQKLIARVWERSVMFHAKAMEAAQVAGDLDELLLVGTKSDKGVVGDKYTAKETREMETRRERMLKEEKHYASLARQDDHLLGMLLGKIKDLNIAIDVTLEQAVLENRPLTVDSLNELAKAQRERQLEVLGHGRN